MEEAGETAPAAICAIDIGTNSIHSVVARFGSGDRFEVLARQKEMVRLGSGAANSSGEMRILSDEAIERAVAALARARQLADVHGAVVAAVATSATREAENAAELIGRARNEAGVEVEVISGYEEARLIHLGVLQAVPVFDREVLVCDIGGGSTEIVLGLEGETRLARSLKLGAIRLSERFFGGSKLHPAALDSCRRHLRANLAPLARPVRALGFEVAVGSSGTIESLTAMALLRDGRSPQSLNNAVLTRAGLERVVKDLVAAESVEDRIRIPGLDPARADIILGGAMILEAVFEMFDVAEMVHSEYALREGVLLDALRRLRGGTRHHLHDLRRRSVVHLMESCDEDPIHAHQAARLSLDLFDGLSDGLGLDDSHRELLEAGALLANVGLVISHSKHHKHSYYVIRNSEKLTGFTDHEIELVAQVARYHRKSPPTTKHPEHARLQAEDRRVVTNLAALLRLGIALDRGRAQRVERVAVERIDGRVVVHPISASGTDIGLELFSAGYAKGLLEDALGLAVSVET